MRQPHPPNAGRGAAGAFRRRVFGDRCGLGWVRGAVGHAVPGRGVWRWRWTARGIFGPASCTAAGARRAVRVVKRSISHGFVRASMVAPGQSRPCRCRRSSCVPGTGPANGTAGARAALVGRRGSGLPRSGCGPSIWATTSIPAGRFAKRSKPRAATSSSFAGRRATGTLGEYLRSTEPREIRRTAGRGSAKRPHRYRWMAGPPLRDGADALRVHLDRGRDRQARRRGDLPQRLRHRPRRHARQHRRNRRLRTRTVEDRKRNPQRARTNGDNPGHNFGHGRGGPGQPAGGARPVGLRRSYRPRSATRTPAPGARKRLPGHMHTPAAHVVLAPMNRLRHRRTPARRRPDTSKPPPQTPTEPPTGNYKSHEPGIAGFDSVIDGCAASYDPHRHDRIRDSEPRHRRSRHLHRRRHGFRLHRFRRRRGHRRRGRLAFRRGHGAQQQSNGRKRTSAGRRRRSVGMRSR